MGLYDGKPVSTHDQPPDGALKDTEERDHNTVDSAGRMYVTVGFRLAQLGAVTARRFHTVVREHDLEPRQLAVLRALGALDGPTQQLLGQVLGIPPSSMVSILDDLEQRGAVERDVHPSDRRAHVVRLTADGRRLLERAMKSAMELEGEICAGLGATEREELLTLLSRVADTLGLGESVPGARGDPASPEDRPEPAADPT